MANTRELVESLKTGERTELALTARPLSLTAITATDALG
jgi:hypothetical protein